MTEGQLNEVTMRKGRIALFGVLLLVAAAAAVSTVVAQTRPDPQPRPRPRVMMLDGRGAQIGVSVDDLNEQALKAAAGAASGVIIEDVDQDSPASRSGLVQGDIITEVDGERVRSARQFSRLIQETPDGRSVKLSVVRDGKKQAIDVTPEARGFGFGDQIAREIERGMRDVEPRLRSSSRVSASSNHDSGNSSHSSANSNRVCAGSATTARSISTSNSRA